MDDEQFCKKLQELPFVKEAVMCEFGVVIAFHDGVTQTHLDVVSSLCRLYADARAEAEFDNCHPTEQ